MPASSSYAPSAAKTGLKSSIFDDIEDTGLLGILNNYILNKTNLKLLILQIQWG